MSSWLPPRNVLSRMAVPFMSSRVMKMSVAPFQVGSYAPAVVGKAGESVAPARVISPNRSICSGPGRSVPAVPRNVLYWTKLALGKTRITKPS
jgi:hypothetical protein